MLGRDILYLSAKDVANIGLGMKDIIDSLEKMFYEKGMGRVEMPPKPGIHTRKDAFIHAMPAYIPKLNSAGMKWVSGYPENYKKKLPYISGLLILNDPETGIPISVMDCIWITAKRTGAATALAAKYLARKNSETVGILGCGVQGYSNLEALNCLFRIKLVKAYDTNMDKAMNYAKTAKKDFGIEVEAVSSPESAVRKSDIVVTAGPILKDTNPVIEDAWFETGAFASPVDFDSYWKHEPFRKADKFFTDDISQMMYYKKEGYFKGIPEKVMDLGDLVAKKCPGRENESERIISVNLGLALDDMAVAPLIHKKALESGLGKTLEL
jgi:ornithine cyclodeaminase/alanine dehydrogenase-like protein (mu-crystallin family)